MLQYLLGKGIEPCFFHGVFSDLSYNLGCNFLRFKKRSLWWINFDVHEWCLLFWRLRQEASWFTYRCGFDGWSSAAFLCARPPSGASTPPVTRHSALEDGRGAAGSGQGRGPDSFAVCVLVYGQLRGQCYQQNHPQWIPVPGYGFSVSHYLHRRLPPPVVAGLGSPQNRTAEQVLLVVHPAFSFREILRIRVGSLQHMESARVVRAHRWVQRLRGGLTHRSLSAGITWWCVCTVTWS